MHQTFYIEIDEEISSVIDRLDKSKKKDNYFILPKRAIFLQSVVNLKLLKREADKVGKNVTIVTQDEIGASMARRSGLSVQTNIDDHEITASVLHTEPEISEYSDVVGDIDFDHDKQKRLSNVGTAGFYDSAHISMDMHSPVFKPGQEKVQIDHVKNEKLLTQNKRAHNLGSKLKNDHPIQHSGRIGGSLYDKGLDNDKEQVLERMYSSSGNGSQKETMKKVTITEGKVKKIFIAFIVLCLFAFIGVAGYLFLPSTKITIEPNIIKNKIDLDLRGSGDINQIDKSVVPVRVIDKEESVSISYQVSGSSSLNSGKKARGSVVIYNEYDKSPQTLIATTRLESSDGKIFRLVKNVVVPGTTTLSGETKAGAISADVIADQSGSDYNVAPGDFKIPGFKDGPKYDKFYAKSTEVMTGGSNGESSENGNGKISQIDIDNAKQKTQAALNEKIAGSIKAAMNDGDVFLPQAQKVIMTKLSTTAKIGDKVSSFECVATASFRVLVFSEKDIRKLMIESLNNKDNKDFKKEISKVEYGTVNADFDKNTLELRVHGDVTAVPIIDSEKIKSELLGKTDGQLESILKKYSTIKNVSVEFKPTFISRISQYPQRVNVEIQNVEN